MRRQGLVTIQEAKEDRSITGFVRGFLSDMAFASSMSPPLRGKTDFLRNMSLTHECFLAEQGFEPEGYLEDFKFCSKSKGHADFISIHKFQRSDLPSDSVREGMYELITARAKLTVRICGKYVSPRRPIGYSLWRMRGKKAKTFGTGWIHDFPERISPCVCAKCDGKPGTVGYRCAVYTANHVIFDDLEAAAAEIDFYADDPIDASSVVTLKGDQIFFNDIDRDWCSFYCITHDENVANRIGRDVEIAREIYMPNQALDAGSVPYHFIISHPHGFSKQVSFGNKISLVQQGGVTFYRYNTPTCFGSSGAHVFDNWNSTANPHLVASTVSHHGIDGDSAGYNRSSINTLMGNS